MASVPFASVAHLPGAGLADLALALAAEFRPVDRSSVARDLAVLGRSLHGAARLEARGQLDALAALIRSFDAVTDPVRRRPLMLDAVLGERAGDPLLLALLATDLGRRAGLDVAIAATPHAHVVTHRRAGGALAVTAGGAAASVIELPEAPAWRCPHQVMRLVLSEIVERSRRRGDLATAIRAAELRLALPLDRRGRLAMRTELAAVRALLN